MIDWFAILISIPLVAIMFFIGWVFLEYPFIRTKEKTIIKTFSTWYKNLR